MEQARRCEDHAVRAGRPVVEQPTDEMSQLFREDLSAAPRHEMRSGGLCRHLNRPTTLNDKSGVRLA